MQLTFRALAETEPGPLWAALFREHWPAYHAWWLREGLAARPCRTESRRAIARHMPEILGLYDRLCELAGGGDAQARFLSFFRPPAYLSACSQAVWQGEEPLLVRNYDYGPDTFDAVVLRTGWLGRQVMGTSDGLWGLVDGINDAGLAVSLAFGGRRAVGDGFGIPILLRYVLQTCETVAQAAAALARIPCHMSYNVTLLDRARRHATVHLSPDRPAAVTGAAVATNHQGRVEWPSHARFTATVERERFLLARLAQPPQTPERFIGDFLRPPLHATAFAQGFGTLYTAAYRPWSRRLELCWPWADWPLDLAGFVPGARRIAMPVAPAPA